MAEELLGPVVRDPRRRARPRLPAPRERGRPVAGARPRVRQALDAQRDAPVHRREDVQVGRERRDDARGARPLRARDAARLLPDGPLAQADRLLRGDDDRGRGARRELPRGLPESLRCRPPRASGSASPPRSTTTSTRPRRSRSCTAGATTSFCGAGSTCSGSSRWRTSRRRCRAEVIELAERRKAARAGRRLRGGRPPARRGGARRAGSFATSPRSPATGSCGDGDARARLRPAAGAGARSAGRARCSRSGRASGRCAPSPGCARPRDSASTSSPSARSTAAAENRRAPGRVAWTEPYRYAEAHELADARAAAARLPRPGHRPAQPRRRHPLGRGCRRDRCDRPGARLRPGHARGRPRLGGRRRAPARRGRPKPRPLPDGDQARRPLGLGSGRRLRDADVVGRPRPAGPRSCSARRAVGSARSSGRPATPPSRSRSPAASTRST